MLGQLLRRECVVSFMDASPMAPPTDSQRIDARSRRTRAASRDKMCHDAPREPTGWKPRARLDIEGAACKVGWSPPRGGIPMETMTITIESDSGTRMVSSGPRAALQLRSEEVDGLRSTVRRSRARSRRQTKAGCVSSSPSDNRKYPRNASPEDEEEGAPREPSRHAGSIASRRRLRRRSAERAARASQRSTRWTSARIAPSGP